MPRSSLSAVACFALALLVAPRAYAQHDMAHMHMAQEQPRHDESAALFQSDMHRMTGMVPVDPMGGMPMPGWGFMTMGVVRFGYNRQGGDRGDDAWESTN